MGSLPGDGYLGGVSESGSADGRRDSVLLGLSLRLVMAATSLPVSITAFVITVTGVALAIGLTPAFLIGVPLFVLVGYLSRAMAKVERARMRLFLDVEIPQPDSRPKGLRAAWTHAPTWRAIGYQVVHLPLGALTFACAISGLGGALALMTMPWWLTRVPAKRADLVVLTVSDHHTAWAVAGSGVAVAAIAFGLTYALTSAEGALAQSLLGPSARELARRVDVLQQSRARVVDAADTERRRIERDLHDGAQQRLVALAMNLGRARARYDDDPNAAREMLEEAHNDAKLALAELRDLTRGLHPAVLSDRGLDAALSGLAARSPVPVTLDVAVEPRCSPTIEAVAYFVVSEALANVAKHSHATAARVTARRDDGLLRLVIEDDGVGGAHATPGSGLSGLADRVGGVDGSLRIDSPPGGPTSLLVEMPCVS
jgi:signal transduction histidine kinase